MKEIEHRLPDELVARASLRGREYAWPLADIPEVIEAARRRGLVSVGGQLQFRFPDGAICECYGIDVDTHKTMPAVSATWGERVEQSAEVAKASFQRLFTTHNMLEEGRKAFPQAFCDLEKTGQDVAQTMCFVWYLMAENDETPVD